MQDTLCRLPRRPSAGEQKYEELAKLLRQERERNLTLEKTMEELKRDFMEVKDRTLQLTLSSSTVRPPSESRISFKSVSDIATQEPSPLPPARLNPESPQGLIEWEVELPKDK